MRIEKNDPTFYAVIATVRPDLLDHDDIKLIAKAFLETFNPADPPAVFANGNGMKPRRRRRAKSKRAKKTGAG